MLCLVCFSSCWLMFWFLYLGSMVRLLMRKLLVVFWVISRLIGWLLCLVMRIWLLVIIWW